MLDMDGVKEGFSAAGAGGTGGGDDDDEVTYTSIEHLKEAAASARRPTLPSRGAGGGGGGSGGGGGGSGGAKVWRRRGWGVFIVLPLEIVASLRFLILIDRPCAFPMTSCTKGTTLRSYC